MKKGMLCRFVHIKRMENGYRLMEWNGQWILQYSGPSVKKDAADDFTKKDFVEKNSKYRYHEKLRKFNKELDD